MLKDEERIAEGRQRIAKKEQQQRLRRRRIISAVWHGVLCSDRWDFAAMPGIIGQVEPSTSSGFETAATIFVMTPHCRIYGDRTAGFYPRRVRDYSVFSASIS